MNNLLNLTDSSYESTIENIPLLNLEANQFISCILSASKIKPNLIYMLPKITREYEVRFPNRINFFVFINLLMENKIYLFVLYFLDYDLISIDIIHRYFKIPNAFLYFGKEIK